MILSMTLVIAGCILFFVAGFSSFPEIRFINLGVKFNLLGFFLSMGLIVSGAILTPDYFLRGNPHIITRNLASGEFQEWKSVGNVSEANSKPCASFVEIESRKEHTVCGEISIYEI